jgi:hypothetical protein
MRLPASRALLGLAASGALLLSLAATGHRSAPAAVPAPDLKALLQAQGRACPAGSAVPQEQDGVTSSSDGVLPPELRGARDAKDAATSLGVCLPGKAPDSPLELARFGGIAATRAGADTAVQLRAAVQQKAALAASAPVKGANGTWKPLGVGPLISDDPTYTETYGNGFADLAGRITDFAYSTKSRTLWTTAAQGGVWASKDTGGTWRSVGDSLPFQSTSGIAWTSFGGFDGTLLVLTGDHAFSNDYAGLGAYWSTDGGTHWNHAAGVPDGALGFKLAVDPTNPKIVYAATGKGLFRSVDGGRHYSDAKLASKEAVCKTSAEVNCFFANIVTDVEVQSKDDFGHKGGAVVAALGWRAGRYPNFNGKPQAPHNGIFTSDTGAPGSFTRVADGNGITKSAEFGRTAFGAAHGTGQNSGYVYALVQNTSFFTTGNDAVSNAIDGDPLGVGVNPIGKTSDLDGVYVSADFGKTWKIMESGRQMANPANGSTLNGLSPLGISAGYQVTYNEWIKPDPTRTSTGGVPTRLVFGIEEIWQADGLPQDGAGAVDTPLGPEGTSNFTTIGNYNQAGACLLTLASHACSTARVPGDPIQTTTHPDQHGGIFITNPEKTGVTLVVGNDGGVYKQSSSDLTPFTQVGFGNGSQTGFHDLLPYGIAMAKDGTAYMGLQDNGEAKIDKTTGKQYMIYGGDGVFTLVDPDNSDIAYEEYPGARIAVTTDGGKSFVAIAPGSALTNPDFVTPLIMDPHNAKHILTGGRQVAETTAGPATTAAGTDPTDWKLVYDLGTRDAPGVKASKETATNPANHVISIGNDGAATYVGYCGSCDPVKLHQTFHGGIATNVSGAAAPKTGTGAGWHIAKAKGLPQRIPTSVTIDPKNHRTVYVTLGASAARYFAPIGSLGESAAAAAGGYVYKSTDAGETFHDITGDLPKVQATWSVLRDGHLLVADALGVFIGEGVNGGHYAPLGTTLPSAPVYMMQLKPGNPNLLVAASFGRGGYTYAFPKGSLLPVDKPGGSTGPGTGPGAGKGPLAATGLGGALPAGGLLLLVLVAGTVAHRRRTT